MKNINGFRLNKNGKPILNESGDVIHYEYQGASYKKDGVYYFFVRKQAGKFIYKS